MVFNVTKDDIRVRMAAVDEDIWPLPSVTEKLAADPADRVGFGRTSSTAGASFSRT